MSRESERKCDTCKYCMSDYNGPYCGCIQNSEYGLFSVYGWCEHYVRDVRYGGSDTTTPRRKFYLNDMSFTFNEAHTYQEMKELFKKAMESIGVIDQVGAPS